MRGQCPFDACDQLLKNLARIAGLGFAAMQWSARNRDFGELGMLEAGNETTLMMPPATSPAWAREAA